MRVVKNVSYSKVLNFPSDHRALQLEIEIPKRGEIKNSVKTGGERKEIFQEDKIPEAKQKLIEKLKKVNFGNFEKVQKINNKLGKILENTT